MKNMETSETVKLPMKYIERCCVGGKMYQMVLILSLEIGETVTILN